MANLSSFVGGQIPGDPYKQPCFAVWSLTTDTGGFNIVDHKYQTMARYMYNNSGSYGGGSAMYSTASPSNFDDFYSSAVFRTDSYSSSGSSYTQGSFTGYLGHLCHTMSWNNGSNSSGEMAGTSSYESRMGQAFRDNGVIVNETHQDYAIWIYNGTMRVGPRSSIWYAHSRNIESNTVTISAKQAGYGTTNYGSMGYNAKTNQMVIMESDGSYGRRPVIYNNVPQLRYYRNNVYRDSTEQYAAYTSGSTGPLYTHFNNAANYTTTYAAQSGKPRNNDGEDNYRGICVMCDNGSVVWYQMIPGGSPNAWISRWDSSGVHSGNLKQWSGTTSYGVDSGNRFGTRYVVSSNGKYVLMHSCYYYYGSGSHVALVRVSDGKIVWDENNRTDHSFTYVPNGASDFSVFTSDNADGGSGVYYQHIDTEHQMNIQGDVTQGNLCNSFLQQIVGSNYNSTDYPRVIPLFYDTAAFCIGR